MCPIPGSGAFPAGFPQLLVVAVTEEAGPGSEISGDVSSLSGHGTGLKPGLPRKVRTVALPGQGLLPCHPLRLHANIGRKAQEV